MFQSHTIAIVPAGHKGTRMDNSKKARSIPTSPTGLKGRCLFLDGSWYGVASNWMEASSPIFVLNGNGEWFETSKTVANPMFSMTKLLTCEDALDEHLIESGVTVNFRKGYPSYYLNGT